MVVITFLGGLWLAPGDIDRWRAIMTLIGTALLVACRELRSTCTWNATPTR